MTNVENQKPYFSYWGKAKKPIEVDYCLSKGGDKEIAERYGITQRELKLRIDKYRWKKVEAGVNYSAFHLLPYHSLDVAAVASIWWDNSTAIQSSFLRQATLLSKEQTKAWVLFFIALHDYGKFDIRFQRKAMKAWRDLQVDLGKKQLVMPTDQDCKTYDHGSAGLYWFDRDRNQNNELSGNFDLLLDIIDLSGADAHEDTWLAWIKPVAGHHGFVYSDKTPLPERPLHGTVSTAIRNQDKIARQAWLTRLEALFLKPVSLSLEDTPPQPSPLLAGFCSVSDWLGSRSDGENFRYKAEPIDDLQNYLEDKYTEDAARVFALSGIQGKSRRYKGVSALLETNYKPRQLQTLVDELPTEPGLTVVEAPTGSGKTEMALAYAWRLIAANRADSIVLAMPTQATANAMLERIEKLATVLFEDAPNLLLAHGNASFNKNFLALKQADKTIQGNEEAWVQCNEWLGQSRKRIFLGQIGICTIDQVLVSVLPVRHRFIRGFGVGRSVLIIDEVHAYDAYMYGLLEAVLRDQQAAGAPGILLSATLPQSLKDKLVATTGVQKSENNDKPYPYPLISWSDGKRVCQYTLPVAEQPLGRTVRYELHENEDLLPDAVLCQRILEAAAQGAQIAIVCNLVDVAQQLARELKDQTNIPVEIFHARYCLNHRQAKEEKVKEYFGKEGKRTSGRILVATQVIEQSLDIDFDWLITQLCPVDLLFQRMGRLHRHERSRPAGFEIPCCTVLLPSSHDYGYHGLIYSNSRVMWRTAHKLRQCKEQVIEFPEAYRDWIEPVYQDEAWGNEPEEIEEAFCKYEDELCEKRRLAMQMLKWADNAAMNDNDERVRAVTRDGEFSLSLVPYLESPKGRQLLDLRVLEELDEWQQAEALALNTVHVPHSWKRLLPEADQEGRIWLTMRRDRELWRSEQNGICFYYRSVWGMEKSGDTQ
ncbi:MAG TPA: CRISPR-associated helicase/endonuclease Cas3 [Gammaproteobacteria bacterium]|nr:CRISPR-associated helicase/endonuclease Cas3 [Gammaproteobacteria bacterium]